MPLGSNRYENNAVQHLNGGRRKHAIQNDDEYHVDDKVATVKDKCVVKRRNNEAEKGRNGENTNPQARNPRSNYKKMERGISKATENEFLINEARIKLEKDFGSLGLHSDVSRSIGENYSRYNENAATNCENDVVTETSNRALVRNRYDRYEDNTSGSSGNTSNSPTHLPGSGSHSEYRIESDNLVISAGNFVENPVYTFILPDLTIYPGKWNFHICGVWQFYKNTSKE